VAVFPLRRAADYQKLFASPADQEIRVAHHPADTAGKFDEQQIAGAMAILVVYLFEVVNVNQIEDEVAVVAAEIPGVGIVRTQCLTGVCRDHAFKEAAVPDPGQVIPQGDFLQGLVGRGQFSAALGNGHFQTLSFAGDAAHAVANYGPNQKAH
jgi:hypothetical protein